MLLVDDNNAVRQGLRRMLELENDLRVVGEASTAEEALRQLEDVSPDIVIMDIRMSPTDGLEATRLMKTQGFTNPIVVLSLYDDHLEQAIQVGVSGYLTKDITREELISAIRMVQQGGFVFGSGLMKKGQGPELIRRLFPRLENSVTQESAPSDVANSVPADLSDEYKSEENTSLKVPTSLEHTAGDVANDAAESSEIPNQAAGSLPLKIPDIVESDVDLVISPPLDSNALLKLHQWLIGHENLQVSEILGSWSGDTIIKVSVDRPTPLLKMLAELPEVAEVTEEVYTGRMEEIPGAASWPRNMNKAGVGGTLPRRIRLVLKK